MVSHYTSTCLTISSPCFCKLEVRLRVAGKEATQDFKAGEHDQGNAKLNFWIIFTRRVDSEEKHAPRVLIDVTL